MKMPIIILTLCCFSAAFAAGPPDTRRNFVTCPIVRDTQTVPCWLAEYEGELYYLGIQTDISAEWHPPYLGHRVLVEGTVTDAYRICGGIVLKPIHTSSLPELDASCNTQVLQAEDQYTVPFAPRGPGPSKGSLAFANPRPAAPTPPSQPFAIKEFVVPYEFDWPWITGRTARVVQQALRYAQASKAHIEIRGYRAASLLSNGTLLTETASIGEQRAKQVAQLLIAGGMQESTLHVQWQDDPEPTDGIADFEKRRVVVLVKPE